MILRFLIKKSKYLYRNKTPKENRYYDNPDTQMHVLLQFLFAKVGINIDALG